VTRVSRHLAIVLVALCAAVADAGWWDDAGAARRATIDDLRKDPDRWRDVTVVMDVRFAGVSEPGNAYFTRFTSKEWRAVGVFAANATPETMNTAEPFARVFVRRGSDSETRLGEIAKGRRVQFRGTVRDAVKGEPWIEVFDVVADGDPLTPEEDAVLARGEELLAHGDPATAETLLRGLATQRALPKAVQAAVWRKIGVACWQERRFAECVDAYAAALAAAPDDRDTVARLAAAKSALANATKPAPATTDAASVAPSAPQPPTSFGTPIPAPRPRLSPPAGVTDTPTPETTTPPAAEPVKPADPPKDDAPPPTPKPTLAGPK
jgi:hypothetical protein